MTKQSAGMLLYRFQKRRWEVFLVHPGGPYWAGKDLGAWSIPKGEYEAGEDPLACAVRELREETGITVAGKAWPLAPVKQKGGKRVLAWAVEATADPAAVKSNLFELEWPPRSGIKKNFPEIDRAAWFGLREAKRKILPGQLPFLQELASRVRKKAGRAGGRQPDGSTARE